VLAPSPNHLRVITKQGFRAFRRRRRHVELADARRSSLTNGATHNQLACSPANDEVVYWCGFIETAPSEVGVILTRSLDGVSRGDTVMSRPAANRDRYSYDAPRFEQRHQYQIYFSDGQVYMARADVNKSDEKIGSWQSLTVEHVTTPTSASRMTASHHGSWRETADFQTSSDNGAHGGWRERQLLEVRPGPLPTDTMRSRSPMRPARLTPRTGNRSLLRHAGQSVLGLRGQRQNLAQRDAERGLSPRGPRPALATEDDNKVTVTNNAADQGIDLEPATPGLCSDDGAIGRAHAPRCRSIASGIGPTCRGSAGRHIEHR
jgi:hypothetical protein